MILSDRELRIALQRGQFLIIPVPPPTAWSSTAVDLCLGASIRRWKDLADHAAMGVEHRFRPAHPDFQFARVLEEFSEQIEIPTDGYVLAPGRFILGWTLERIRIPSTSRLAARVEGKSSLARLGLGIHVTAPTIHGGFGEAKSEGIPLQLEIWNVGPLPIELQAGMRICQLIVEEVHGTPEQGYEGQFREQGPASSA